LRAFRDILRTSPVRWRTLSEGTRAAAGSVTTRCEAKDIRKTGLLREREFAMSRLRGSDYYHRRADQLRLAARETQSSDNRDTLLSFAAYFDGRADEAQYAEATQPEKAAAC
jgi:hypothetical protein